MITSSLDKVMDEAAKKVIERLQSQLMIKRSGMSPMNTTGVLKESIKFTSEPGLISSVEIKSEDYGAHLDKGIINVPYQRGSGAGQSNYIKGLQRWAKIKFGLNSKKALQMAFAIANTQKKSLGNGSFFNQAPANPGWIDEIKDELDKDAAERIHETVFTAIQVDVFSTLNIKI